MGTNIEERIREIGSGLLEHARREEAELAQKHKWENALLDWCMEHEELKIRTFQFIDVFPELKSSRSVLKHIREYFPASEHRLPRSIRAGLALTHPAFLTHGAVERMLRTMFERISKLFIAARDEKEALEVVEALDREGATCSLDLLGEKTMSEAEAESYLARYKALIEELSKGKLGTQKQNVSVKLSALEPRFDAKEPAATSLRVRKRLRELLRLARRNEVFLHIDMEEYELRDLTLTIVRDLLAEREFKSGAAIGIVLQAYLKDVDRCLEHVLAWAVKLPEPLTIRLVRGAYWDQEIMKAREHQWPVPVFTRKSETDAMFERLAERIVREIPKVRLATATHNIRSIAHTAALAEARGLARGQYEFQLLYGMGAPLMGALRKLNHAPRMYAPVGEPVRGMAYLVRRLLENVASQSFVRRGIHERTDAAKLLEPPAPEDAQPKQETLKDQVFCSAPPMVFFDSAAQRKFDQALESVGSRLPGDVPLIIDGKVFKKPEWIETASPIDGSSPVVRAAKGDPEDADQAVGAASKKFRAWAKEPVSARAGCLRRAAAWMMSHRTELAAAEVYEVGKPRLEADADIKEAVDFLNYYAYAAELIERDRATEMLPDEINWTKPFARGVCAVIAPWNFPIAILTGMSAAALATGNTVVLKPAEQSIFSGWKVFQAYQAAGIPDGVVNFLPGFGEEVGRFLVEDPRVAVVAFTGSKAVGLDILARSGVQKERLRHVKKLIIEMGGKNAAIVDETADFDQTIPAVLYSAFGYAGQKCSALSRLIIVDSIYERFVKRLAEAADSFPVGSPLHPGTLCGPVIEKSAQERILAAIEEGRRAGRVVFEKEIPEISAGYYVPPAIIADLPGDSQLLREEIFGPVLAVMRAKNLDEALGKANDSEFALTGGFFSRTPSHIERAKNEFEVGNLYINRHITGAVVGRHPFGGFKLSGTGTKAGGVNYLREFLLERHVSENVARHGFAPLQAD